MNNKEENRAAQKQAYHIFEKLNKVEKLSIRIVYFKKWRKLVNSSGLENDEKSHFSMYFKEIHAHYYTKVVRGPSYIQTSRLVLNFLLSKANENLRAILLSLNPYNLTVFIHAIRSQIELNALVNKFISDNDYHKEHLLYNEDRTKAKELKTVTNINTLVEKLNENYIPYRDIYSELSLLLHPNPSAIKFYAQASGTPTENGSGVFRPKIKYYFDETITPTKEYDQWFKDKIWLFLTCIEHFTFMMTELKHSFFINETEEEQFKTFAWVHFMQAHGKEILAEINKAENTGNDISTATQDAINKILQKSALENSDKNDNSQ